MIWWVDQPVRAQSERIAIGDLAHRSSWISNVSWRLGAGVQLIADFDLEVGDQTVPLTLQYPDFFPDAAPSVLPRNGLRLSGHQYGAAGELCLEYRPDNWSPEITGAMMIQSAYTLLSSENITGKAAPSDHRSVPNLRTRGAILRFLLGREAATGIASIAPGRAVDVEVQEHEYADCCMAQLSRIGAAAEPEWIEPDRRGAGARNILGWLVRLQDGQARASGSFPELTDLLKVWGFPAVATDVAETSEWRVVIIFDGVELRCEMVFGGADIRRKVSYQLVLPETGETRLDAEYARLATSKVGIVGCGSIGSKVAVHLARSGVNNFVLVDRDVLHSGNLVRNELDWRAVGLHKSTALAGRLKEIRSGCEVISRSTVLAGQESGGTAASTMSDLQGCDVLVEATAEADVFNLCAAIARRIKKPMCWAQAFGGGAGGIVVRLRPEVDPVPLEARLRIESWYRDQGVEWPDTGPVERYGDTDEGGRPLIADDADVTVIAAHLSRMVIDILARPGATIFPYSAYVIGLRERWLFEAPFDTRPIDLGDGHGWGAIEEEGGAEALKELLADLFPGARGEG